MKKKTIHSFPIYMNVVSVRYMQNLTTKEIVKLDHQDYLLYSFLLQKWLDNNSKPFTISERQVGKDLAIDRRTVGNVVKRLKDVGVLEGEGSKILRVDLPKEYTSKDLKLEIDL